MDVLANQDSKKDAEDQDKQNHGLGRVVAPYRAIVRRIGLPLPIDRPSFAIRPGAPFGKAHRGKNSSSPEKSASLLPTASVRAKLALILSSAPETTVKPISRESPSGGELLPTTLFAGGARRREMFSRMLLFMTRQIVIANGGCLRRLGPGPVWIRPDHPHPSPLSQARR